MLTSLPQDVESLLNESWADIESCFSDLAAVSLSTANVAKWLADVSLVEAIIHKLERNVGQSDR